MKYFLVVLAIWLRLTLGSAQNDDNMQWTHHAVLDHEGKVHLYWTNSMQGITFEVQAETKGYIGVGFSPDGGMPGSDIAVGWVINNEPTLQDRYAASTTEPTMDAKQDYKLLRGYENDTHTVLRFQRAYDTCDREDMKITNDTMRVVYAYHMEDPVGDLLMVHQKAGHRSLYLAGFNNVAHGVMPDSKTFEMRMHNITLPMSEKSLCWEKIFKYIPATSNDAIIGFEPIWRNSTVAVIDHIWLYKCDVMVGDSIAWDRYAEDKGQKCGSSLVPTQYTNCTQIIATATAGSMGYILPSKVGYTFKSSPSVYFMMKIAYRGWTMKEDLHDDSGIVIITSSSQVSYQASTMTVGHDLGISQIIPIDQKEFVSVGHCDSECTQKGLPADGIYVYEVFLKAQHHGKKMTLRHLRKGTELAPLASDHKFLGENQVYRAYLDPVHILPGDNLVLECSYDTHSAQSTVLGGIQGDNETCLAYLNYFPQVELKSCTSSPPLSQIYQWLGTKQAINVEPTNYNEVAPNGQDPKLVEYLKNYNWVTRAPEYQNIVRENYTAVCSYGSANSTVSSTKSAPKVENPFYEYSKCEGFGMIVENNNTKDQQPGFQFPQGPTGHDQDHSGHGHGEPGHDLGEQGPVGQDPMLGDHPGHDHSHDLGSMNASHPNSIDGSTPMPDHGDHSASSQHKPGGNSSVQVTSSFTILLLAMLILLLSGKP